MGGRRHNVLELIAAHTNADRQASAESFCNCYNVGLYAEIFKSKQLAGSAYARLHLINNHKNIVCVAIINKLFDVGFIKDINSALALDKLKHNRAGILVYCVFKSLYIICLNIGKAFGKWEKIVVKNVLSRCRKCGNGSAVERIFERDNFIPNTL